MRLAVGIIALCACNRTFGLHDVVERDAPPIDAPFACPDIGVTPQFSPLLRQYAAQKCDDFARYSSGLEMATCTVDTLTQVYAGRDDGPLGPTSLVSIDGSSFREPRPSPDGALLLVIHDVTTGPTFVYHEQYRNNGGVWVMDGVLDVFSGYTIGTLAQDRGTYRLAAVAPSGSVEEWRFAGGWSMAMTFSTLDLGVTGIAYAALSEDGLRMLVVATPDGIIPFVYYTDRPTTTSRFRHVTLLDNVPGASAPFLASDCARIYVSGLDVIFYAQQQ